jgi:hypothetical protein
VLSLTLNRTVVLFEHREYFNGFTVLAKENRINFFPNSINPIVVVDEDVVCFLSNRKLNL